MCPDHLSLSMVSPFHADITLRSSSRKGAVRSSKGCWVWAQQSIESHPSLPCNWSTVLIGLLCLMAHSEPLFVNYHLQSQGSVWTPDVFFIKCKHSKQTARGPWIWIHWIEQKVYGDRITDWYLWVLRHSDHPRSQFMVVWPIVILGRNQQVVFDVIGLSLMWLVCAEL